VQFYNFEDLPTLSLGDYTKIHQHITGLLTPDAMNYIFLDEVQNVANFERMVDSLFIKKNVDLYITGSNAWLLSGELATLLTGRFVEIAMLPFLSPNTGKPRQLRQTSQKKKVWRSSFIMAAFLKRLCLPADMQIKQKYILRAC
jgi:predicted AAA+ superfamily ATPase